MLTAVENVEGSVHNLVVCTLCSCYPISVLGMSPHWYRSRCGLCVGCVEIESGGREGGWTG